MKAADEKIAAQEAQIARLTEQLNARPVVVADGTGHPVACSQTPAYSNAQACSDAQACSNAQACSKGASVL